MAKVSDITLQPVRHTVGYQAYNSGAAAVGATTSAVTTSAINYTNGGIFASKTMTNQSIAIAAGYGPNGSNGYVQPAGTTVYYVIALDLAGTVYVYQGSFVGQTVAGQTWVGDGSVPDVSPTLTPVTLIKVASGGSTFTPGTTALTGISTFYNIAMLPATNP